MSSISTLKTGNPIDNPDFYVFDVDNDVGSNSPPVISKKDLLVNAEKDNNDMSQTVNKRSSGSTLVSLGEDELKKRIETRKFFCILFSCIATNCLYWSFSK